MTAGRSRGRSCRTLIAAVLWRMLHDEAAKRPNCGDEGAKVGLELAESLLEDVEKYCQGTYLVPSFGRYEDMSILVKRIKTRVQQNSALNAKR